MKVKEMTVARMAVAVETLQEVQQTNPPHSREWQAASALLKELYAEMAARIPGCTGCDSDMEMAGPHMFYCETCNMHLESDSVEWRRA